MNIFKRFAQKQVESKVKVATEKELGSKSLSDLAKMLRGVIAVSGPKGQNAVRTRLIDAIEDDMRRAAKSHNPQEAVDKLLKDATSTLAYMELLKDVGLTEDNLRFMASEALKEVKD